MTGLSVRTCAKVNFCLRVLGKRRDGYHHVQTVLHTVGLWDEVRLSLLPDREGITFRVAGEDVPADESNLCWRAARLLSERAKSSAGVSIALTKSIPVSAGLGGGSSDAAATLAGLARLWQLDLPAQELDDIAAELGADVPFFLHGGCGLGRGRGEELSPLPSISLWLVLVIPERRVPTVQAYAALARGASRGRRRALTRAIQRTVAALEAADPVALAEALHNDFEKAPMTAIAEAREVKAALLDAGCQGAALCGSGSGVFGLSPDRDSAARIAARIGARWSRVEVVPTVPAGSSLLVSELPEADPS
jgi:4-diphosphocytidyl-2-C-methyl-D-erythritol kinase